MLATDGILDDEGEGHGEADEGAAEDGRDGAAEGDGAVGAGRDGFEGGNQDGWAD